MAPVYSFTYLILNSRSRSLLVKQYLQKHFHLRAMDIATVPLGPTPPEASGKTSWNGVCIVFLAKRD